MDELFEQFAESMRSIREKSILARKVAAQARKKGDLRKWDKFNAVARVHHMNYLKISALVDKLYRHTSEEYQSKNFMMQF